MDFDKVKEGSDYLIKVTKTRPKIGIICGSGVAILSELIEEAETVSYTDIPNFKKCTAPGHESVLMFGKISGVEVMLMKGRYHLYEGYTVAECSLPVRVMKQMGVKIALLTNAAGGINQTYKTGDIMVLKDHINFPGFAGVNPLCGPNDERFGPRFFGLSDCYDPVLRKDARQISKDCQLNEVVKEGVYACVAGPSFETPAELRMLGGACGADAVGMSTTYEAITARHCGLRVAALSVISNVCILEECKKENETGRDEEHGKEGQETLDAVAASQQNLKTFVKSWIANSLAKAVEKS